jgi:hypothetical protein
LARSRVAGQARDGRAEAIAESAAWSSRLVTVQSL